MCIRDSDTVARAFEGREVLLLTITSEANHARLADLQRDAQRVADPRGAAPGEIDAAVRRLPAVVWLAHSVHGGGRRGWGPGRSTP